MSRFHLLILTALLASCSPAVEGDAERVERELQALDLRGRLAQLIVVPAGVSAVLGGEIVAGGAMFDGQAVLSAPAAADTVQRIPPLLVAELLFAREGARPTPLARLIGTAPAGDLREAGRQGAREALAAGVRLGMLRLSMEETVRSAPRADGMVAERIEALLEGVASTGLPFAVEVYAAAAGHPTPLPWDLSRLQAVEGLLLQAAAGAGAAALIVGPAPIPALTGDTLPLPLSPVTAPAVRRDQGWNGVLVVDLSPGSPLLGERDAGTVAIAALAAGSDLILAPAEPGAVLDSLAVAAGDGRLPAERIDAAVRRVLHARLRADRIRARGGVARASASPSASPWPRGDTAATDPHTLAPEAAGMNPEGLARADAAISRALEDGLFTGAALAVARSSGVAHLRGFGTQSDGAPVDPVQTIFDLASLTKVIATTTAVALLVEEGRLGLDDPVRAHLPDFEGDDKDRITVRHLLAHTSGMPPGLWLYGSARSPEVAMRQVIRQRLRRPPGEQAEYSDLGMILLARVAEIAAGEPLDSFLARRLFLPLGMHSTMFIPPTTLRARVIPTALRNERGFVLHGVVHDGNAFRLGGVAGHAGLFSTPREVLRFGEMMLHGGAYGGVRVLETETVSAFTRLQPGAGTRALGWDTPADRSSAGRFLSARSYGHTGYTGTSLWIDPQLDLVVVLLTNRTYDGGSPAGILALRRAVHEAVAGAIADQPVPRRPGSR
jgi:serine-type D-Ala-D-Ala carboxypeptidase